MATNQQDVKRLKLGMLPVPPILSPWLLGLPFSEFNARLHSSLQTFVNNLTIHPESARKRKRIHFSNGYWWLFDPEEDRNIRLDPKIAQCGWNVGRLCQCLGIGKRTFSRMVEEGLGITSKRWLREIRIVNACHLLREGGKIEAVANTLGFRHASDFTREFKKLIGVMPSDYMRAERSRFRVMHDW